ITSSFHVSPPKNPDGVKLPGLVPQGRGRVRPSQKLLFIVGRARRSDYHALARQIFNKRGYRVVRIIVPTCTDQLIKAIDHRDNQSETNQRWHRVKRKHHAYLIQLSRKRLIESG